MRKELEAKQKEQGKGQKEHAKMIAEQQKLQKELNAVTIDLHELPIQPTALAPLDVPIAHA